MNNDPRFVVSRWISDHSHVIE